MNCELEATDDAKKQEQELLYFDRVFSSVALYFWLIAFYTIDFVISPAEIRSTVFHTIDLLVSAQIDHFHIILLHEIQ